MNRERLTILRDHLASLPDERVDMMEPNTCGSASCIGGWSNRLFLPEQKNADLYDAQRTLGLSDQQYWELFYATEAVDRLSELTRTDAIAAIQSMLDSPDDDALPVWPERA